MMERKKGRRKMDGPRGNTKGRGGPGLERRNHESWT